LTGACLARWQNFGTDSEGRQIRYAVWVDDESSRIDVTQIGTKTREDGLVTAEIPFFAAGVLTGAEAAKQSTWRTGASAGVTLGDSKFPKDLSFVSTSFSRGYDVLAHTPSYAQSGSTQKNGYDLPLRGRAKRNLNWSGHTQGNVDTRVERLTEWMANGAQGFFNKRNLSYWPHVSGGSALAPDYQTLPTSNPFASNLRMEQFRTISASLIDYLDTDNIPTQPASLAALNFGNPNPGASPVRLMDDVARPAFFGADRTIRINEVQIIWNSRGAADNYKANTSVERTTIGAGLYNYVVHVTYRFELWNMDENPIPATSYEVRTTNNQQILGSAFGTTGEFPIPEETENVFSLNEGNPIPFAPNQIRVFDITRRYERRSNLDRGTTWNSFRITNGEQQPRQTTLQAHVLLNASTGEWLHATNNVQMSGAPVEGVVSAGVGNKGDSKGSRVNDPRMTPLRMYIERTHPNYDPYDRDWASNAGGKMGFVNNGFNSFNYQDFSFWLDRPYPTTINSPLQGITRVENRPMRSVGELGLIFDPSWTHPTGRGGTSGPYNRNVLSPFKGGGSLAVGQASRATVGGTTAADHIEAKPWNIMDIFAIKGDASGMSSDEYGDLEWRGRINLNCQKNFALGAGTKSNHELVMELPDLKLGAAGRPTKLDFKAVATELKNRLTKGSLRPDGSAVTDWKRAMPLYSAGQFSELETWGKTAAFSPAESSANNDLKLLNRSDYAREEAMMRTANLVTTRSHCYRVLTAGEVIDRAGKLLGRRLQENVIFFNCTWDASTGELKTVKPVILYVRSL
jgi:hypothetical protein